MLNIRTAAACAALLLAAVAPAHGKVLPNKPPAATASKAVVLQPQPGTPLDATVRSLVVDDLASAKARGDVPLVLIGRGNIGATQPALFVQLQSAQECGSAGCSTTVFSWERGAWRQVLDGVTGRITIDDKRTRGRADLVSDDDRFVWTGSAYRSIHPTPNLDLRPHPARKR